MVLLRVGQVRNRFFDKDKEKGVCTVEALVRILGLLLLVRQAGI